MSTSPSQSRAATPPVAPSRREDEFLAAEANVADPVVDELPLGPFDKPGGTVEHDAGSDSSVRPMSTPPSQSRAATPPSQSRAATPPSQSRAASSPLPPSKSEDKFLAAETNVADMLDELPPPTEGDTPRTKKAQFKLYTAMKNGMHVLERVHKDFKTRRASEALSSDEERDQDDGEEEDDGENEDDGGGNGKRRRRRKKGKTVSTDSLKQGALLIIGAREKESVDPDEYLSCILHPENGTNKRKEEIKALEMVVRGFAAPGEDWYQKIHSSASSLSLAEFCNTSASFPEADLIDRDYHLSRSRTHFAIETSGIDYLHRVESIIVQYQYNRTNKNRRDYIKQIDERIFEFRYSDHWEGMGIEAKIEQMNSMKKERKAVKKEREDLVMARNQLLRAYNFFGTAVILHPMFTLSKLGRSRSKSFNALLDTLWQTARTSPDQRDAEVFEEHEDQNKQFLYDLYENMCGGDNDDDNKENNDNNDDNTDNADNADKADKADETIRNYLDNFYTLYPPFQAAKDIGLTVSVEV